MDVESVKIEELETAMKSVFNAIPRAKVGGLFFAMAMVENFARLGFRLKEHVIEKQAAKEEPKKM